MFALEVLIVLALVGGHIITLLGKLANNVNSHSKLIRFSVV